ncbi:MAG: aminomethyltransferase family protein [Stackebrandtia sp.]
MVAIGAAPQVSPLHSRHERLGASFAEFFDWRMPRAYGDVGEECEAVRQGAGVFDLSCVGKLTVSGDGVAEFLNKCLTNDLNQLDGPGKAQYTLACEPHGGVIADMDVYRFGLDDFMLFPASGGWLETAKRLHRESGGVFDIRVMHQSHVVLAVEGPGAASIVERVGLPAGHDPMKFHIGSTSAGRAFVCRSDRLGEHGYQITAPIPAGQQLWDALIEAGARPCGGLAREVLRLEAGLPVVGSELGGALTPVEARLGWAVGWSKPDFWGKPALDAQRTAGPKRRLWGLRVDAAETPEPDTVVYDGDEPAGRVTSAGFSTALGQPIALAALEATYGPGAELRLKTPDGTHAARVVKPPFVDGTPR